MLVLCLNEWTYRHTFLTLWWGHHYSFSTSTAVTEFQGDPSVGALNALGWEIFLQILPFISEMVQDRAIIGMEY